MNGPEGWSMTMENGTLKAFTSKFRPGQSGAKNRCCSICGQAFARTEHLTRHERSHRGEKPFRCNLCATQFCRKDLLKRHVRRLHPEVALMTTTAHLPDTNQGSQGSHARPDLTEGGQGLSFDPVLNWGPATPNFAAMHAQLTIPPLDVTNIMDVDLDNLMSDIYYDDSPLKFQNIDNLSSPLTNPQAAILSQLTPTTTTSEGNESAPTARGTFDISEAKRSELISFIKEARPELDITLPSCFALERFLAACFDSLYGVTPCVHVPSWSAQNGHPCLVLAMAACGAKYSQRDDLAKSLRNIARMVTFAQIYTTDGLKLDQPPSLIQALFLVTGFGVWSGQLEMCREAMVDHSLLAELLRSGMTTAEDQTVQSPSNAADDWETWVANETAVRSKYAILYYLCLVTLVFDTPPAIRTSEVNLPLPCSEAEWTAPSAADWARNRSPTERVSLSDALDSFLTPSAASIPIDSPFTALVILHALIQHIWFWRQDRWHPAPELQLTVFRTALDKLESASQFGSESTISPHNSRAPLVYNFHSLLRLARIYLCADMGKLLTAFKTHDVKKISQAMATQLTVERSIEGSQAALAATQALRVPLKFGVFSTSGSGTLHYYFNTFQCGLYLSKWLQSIQVPPETNRTEKEIEAISAVQSTVNEVDLSPEQAARPLSAQIGYACSIILGAVKTWGLPPLLLTALNEYANSIPVN